MEFGGGATVRNDFLRDSQHQHYSREKPEPMMNWKPTPAEDAEYASCSSTASSSYASLMVRSKPPLVTASTPSSSQQRLPQRLRRSLSAGRRYGRYIEMDSNSIVEQQNPPSNKTYQRYRPRDGSFSSAISTTAPSDLSLEQGTLPSKSCFAALVGDAFQNRICFKQQPSTESENSSVANQNPDQIRPPHEQERFEPQDHQQQVDHQRPPMTLPLARPDTQRKSMQDEGSCFPSHDQLLFSSKHLAHVPSDTRLELEQKLAEQQELAEIQQRALQLEREKHQHVVQVLHHSGKPKSRSSSTRQPPRSEQPQPKDIVLPGIPASRDKMVRQPKDAVSLEMIRPTILIHTSGSSNQPIQEPPVSSFRVESTKEDQPVDMKELKQCHSQDDSITPIFQQAQKNKSHAIISLQQIYNMEGPLDPRQMLVGTPQASSVSSFKIMAEQPPTSPDSQIKHKKTLKKKKKKNHVEIDLESLSEVVKSHGSLGDQDVDDDTNSESAQVKEAEQPLTTTTTRDKKDKVSHYFVDGYEGDYDPSFGISPVEVEKKEPEGAPPSVPVPQRTFRDTAAVPTQRSSLPPRSPHQGQMIIVVSEEGDQSTISSMSFGSHVA